MSQLLIFLALAVFVALLMQKKSIDQIESLHQNLSVNLSIILGAVWVLVVWLIFFHLKNLSRIVTITLNKMQDPMGM
tara:strand:+ start:444 stop:674 length:231 start_codon:yes stop_codon:yes gene_type:complete